jgi:hypothetical protein
VTSFYGDNCVADQREYPASQDVINASGFITEVAHLEAALPI